MSTRRARFVVLPALLLTLGACGGTSDGEPELTCDDQCSGATDCVALCLCEGGSDASCASECPESQRLQPPTDWPASAEQLEADLLARTNEMRREGGCCDGECFEPSAALTSSDELTLAARVHAEDMSVRQYFAHESPEGTTPFDRMRAMHFEGCAMGENLAEGLSTASAVIDAWLQSKSHCENLLAPRYRQMGAGYAEGASALGPFWVQTLGD